MKKITVLDILQMKEEGRKIAVLTAYSFPVARIIDTAGIPLIIIGDSAGMVEAGLSTTLPVTLDEMVYHTKAVVRGRVNALTVADMPFGSYQVGIEEARKSAARLVKEGGAEAVKVEGGRRSYETIKAIVDMDIPVMGHIGLTPQSIHRMGGYRVQGRSKAQAKEILRDARAVADAGAFSIVLEGIPASLSKEVTEALSIPTIGIGAGPHCDGQVLVINDLLGLTAGVRTPKYVKRYADLDRVIREAVSEYIVDVEEGKFPDKEHSY